MPCPELHRVLTYFRQSQGGGVIATYYALADVKFVCQFVPLKAKKKQIYMGLFIVFLFFHIHLYIFIYKVLAEFRLQPALIWPCVSTDDRRLI